CRPFHPPCQEGDKCIKPYVIIYYTKYFTRYESGPGVRHGLSHSHRNAENLGAFSSGALRADHMRGLSASFPSRKKRLVSAPCRRSGIVPCRAGGTPPGV